jgi:hypothetical protein
VPKAQPANAILNDRASPIAVSLQLKMQSRSHAAPVFMIQENPVGEGISNETLSR